jgi:hypothetical protein
MYFPPESVSLKRSINSSLKSTPHKNINYATHPMASPSPPNHQPDAHIAIVGWRQSNNGRCCSSHPTGCGQRWHNSGTAGAEFKLRRVVLPGEELALACYEVNADGSLGCHVAFAQKQYANAALIGIYHNATVKITAMYGMWSESKWERQMDKFNFGYAPAEVVNFAQD